MSDIDYAALIAEARTIQAGGWYPVRADLRELAGEWADALESLTASLSVSERSDATVTEVTAPATDPWCREESCRYRYWRSGSMPTHKRGGHCPPPATERRDSTIAPATDEEREVIGRFAFDGAEGIAFHIYSDDSQEHPQARIMFDDLEDLKAFLTHNLPGLFGGDHAAPDDDEREALINAVDTILDAQEPDCECGNIRLHDSVYAEIEAAVREGFRRSSRVPVSRDELAHFLAGEAFWYEPQRTLAFMRADALLSWLDIFPKADRKPADSGTGGDS